MNKKELWLAIANYHFDHLVPTHFWDEVAAKFGGQSPFTKAFADKLCRKLNWEKRFALRAIWEYKKFVYLGVISEFSVTPSKVIDQVWHEHLLFSAGYRNFCKEIIHYDFDHNPELVSVDNQIATFQSQYFHTIDLYRREFGSEPPAEIWESTKFTGKLVKLKKLKKIKFESANSVGENYHYSGEDTLMSMFSIGSNGVEFGGGEFGGGGAGSSWDFAVGDSSSGDSDSGGSDSGSSCSSSCGGGGCGGD